MNMKFIKYLLTVHFSYIHIVPFRRIRFVVIPGVLPAPKI